MKARLVIATAIVAMLTAAFIITRPLPPLRPLPSTSLTFVALTNLPPVGTMTAFSISNGSPRGLIYNPTIVEYRASNKWVAVPSDSIVNRVGVVAPGQIYVFFVPGAVTNRSLRIHVICRDKAKTGGLLAKAEYLVSRIGRGKTEAWLGKRYEATLTEAEK